MHYLIDGYNLLFRILKKCGSLEKERQLLIRELNDAVSHLKLNVTLVFDGSQEFPFSVSRGHFESLEIVYTPKHQSADDYILEEVNSARAPQHLIIVTNDRELKGKCHQMRAKIMTIDQFLSSLVQKRQKKKRREIDQEAAFRESQPELSRLLIIFEKKLLEDLL